MASPEELKRQQELNRLKRESVKMDQQAQNNRSEIVNLSFSIVESLKEALGIVTRTSDADKSLLKVNREINKAIVDRSKSFSSISDLNKEIAKSSKLIDKSQLLGKGLAKSIGAEKEKELQKNIEAYKLQQLYQKELEDAQRIIQQGGSVEEDILNHLKERVEEQGVYADIAMEGLSATQQQYVFNKLNSDVLQEQVDKQKQITESLGVAGGFADIIGKIPGLGGFASDALAGVTEELQEASDAGGEMPGTFDTMNNIIGKMGEGIITKLKDPFTLILAAVTALSKMLSASDRAAGELAKGMNTSYQNAQAMRLELNAQATQSDSIFSTTEKLSESLLAINSTLGTNVMLNKQDLETFTMLREAAGFTNEELMGMQAISLATGTSLESNTGEFLAQAKSAALANGVLLNEKDLMKDIGNVSAATTLSFGKNPGLIAQAVATTKALGMEMSKVEGIAGSLLNFEQSIEDELSAELLLGKNINLEKARQAALNNDLATVATEIVKQAGTSAEFAEMNRLQQDALAKSVGMSRDELAETLFVQEQISGASGEEAAKQEKLLQNRIKEVGLAQAQKELAEGSLEEMEAQASTSERMAATMDKIQSAFMGIADIILQIVDPLVNIIAPVFNGISYTIGLIVSGLKEMAPALAVVGIALAAMNAQLIFGAIMSVIRGAWAALGAIPFVGPVLALAAIAGGIGLIKSQKVQDGIAPSSKGPFTITDSYGAMATTTAGDSLMASPNVGRGGGGGGDNKAMAAMANSLKTIAQSSADTAKGLKRQKPVPLYQITRG